jgi:hypothetical protein
MAYFNIPTTVSFNQSLGSTPGYTWKVYLPAAGGCCDGGDPEVVIATSATNPGSPNNWNVTGDPTTGTVTVVKPSTYSVPSGREVWVAVYAGVDDGCGGTAYNEYLGMVLGLGDQSYFISLTVSLTMTVGGTYSVNVKYCNKGDTTWTAAPSTGINLGSENARDNTLWGVNRWYYVGSIVPGDTLDFTFDVTAPAAGTRHMQFGMVHDGAAWFGPTTDDKTIIVSAATGHKKGALIGAIMMHIRV